MYVYLQIDLYKYGVKYDLTNDYVLHYYKYCGIPVMEVSQKMG